MLKGIKIRETFQDFLEEHPELQVVRNSQGAITAIIFPPEAEQTSYSIVFDQISVHYHYQGKAIHFFTQ